MIKDSQTEICYIYKISERFKITKILLCCYEYVLSRTSYNFVAEQFDSIRKSTVLFRPIVSKYPSPYF